MPIDSTLSLVEASASLEEKETLDIPIDIGDIIGVCKEYSALGWQIQTQIEAIKEFGLEDGVKRGSVKAQSLPLIRDFFKKIVENAWFGDAAEQAYELIMLIDDLELRKPELFKTKKN
jgi:hypothetical protein